MMSFNLKLLIVFVVVCFSGEGSSSYLTTFTGKLFDAFRLQHHAPRSLPYTLSYDRASRAFKLEMKPPQRSEARDFSDKKKKAGFFGGLLNMVQETFFQPYGWPRDRKPQQKTRFKSSKKATTLPPKDDYYDDDDDDNDPISNFLDSLDDMIAAPFSTATSTEESSERNPTTKQFKVIQRKSTTVTTPRSTQSKVKSTKNAPNTVTFQVVTRPPYLPSTISYAQFLASAKPQKKRNSKRTTILPSGDQLFLLNQVEKDCADKPALLYLPPAVQPEYIASVIGVNPVPSGVQSPNFLNLFRPSTIAIPPIPSTVKTPIAVTFPVAPTAPPTIATTPPTVPTTTSAPLIVIQTTIPTAPPITTRVTSSPANQSPYRPSRPAYQALNSPSAPPQSPSKFSSVRPPIFNDMIRKPTTTTTTHMPFVLTPVPSTASTKPASSGSFSGWLGGFFGEGFGSGISNFIFGDDDGSDDVEADDEDSQTLSSSSIFPMLFPLMTSENRSTTTTPAPTTTTTTEPARDWFSLFLDVEEDDGAYVVNKTVKPKKSSRKDYTGYQLLRIYPDNSAKVQVLKDMQEEIQASGLMWWTSPMLNRPADLLIPSKTQKEIKEYLDDEDMKYNVIIWDLQNAINYENPRLSKVQRLQLEESRGHPMTWRRYHRYADILRYLEYLSLKYPEIVELVPLGRSYEGLPIVVAKVSLPEDPSVQNQSRKRWKLKSRMKPAIWIDGGSHARDWIAPAVATWILHTLVEGAQGTGTEWEMIRSADWYILPVVNPDGYEYTHTRDRLWRKSRSQPMENDEDSWFSWNWDSKCIGVDLNRNWEFHWGEKGSSTNPCSDYYSGPYAFSEPETKAIADFIMQNNDRIKVFLSLFAYSQMWMLPSNFKKDPIVDKDELMEMGKLALLAVKDVSGTNYDVAQAEKILQPVSGTSHDWAKGRARIKYSYSVKLRDSQGPYGYLLPGSQIIPTAKETWEGIKAIVDNL